MKTEFFLRLSEKYEIVIKQECIPVGCVPSAAVAVSGGGVVCLGGVCLGGVCLGVSVQGVCLPRREGEEAYQVGGVCPEGVYAQGMSTWDGVSA